MQAKQPLQFSESDTSGKRPTRRGRLLLLLPMRGLLALGVVIAHASQADVGGRFARVILFFVISGYCIAHAADRSLGGAASEAGRFLERRVRRLWPPLACALAYLMFMRWVLGFKGAGYRPHQDALAWVQNLTFTNWVSMLGETFTPPWKNRTLLVGPHWTLGYEMQFYVLVGVFMLVGTLARVRMWWLAAGLALIGATYNLMLPARWTGTLIDYALCFGLGGLVWAHVAGRGPRWLGISVGAVVVGLAAFAWHLGNAEFMGEQMQIDRTRDAYHSVFVAAVGAGVLLLLARIDHWWTHTPLARMFNALGTISYSLFLVHPINAPLARMLTERALPEKPAAWVWMGVYVALQITLAAAFWWACERPWTQGPGERGAV